MLTKRALIPAIAAVALFMGCDNKPTDKIPTTAPTAIKEPYQVLKHLQYIAVRKDMKDLTLIAPLDLEVVYGSAWWFTKHAGDMGVTLTEEEIDKLGATDLRSMGYLAPNVSRKELQENLDKLQAKTIAKLPAGQENLDPDKLDQLPLDKLPNGKPNPAYLSLKDKYSRVAMSAGLYRLLKCIPDQLWPEIAVMEVKKNPSNAKVQNVFLGCQGTPVLEVGVIQNPDGNYGVSYLHYKVSLKKLQNALPAAEKK